MTQSEGLGRLHRCLCWTPQRKCGETLRFEMDLYNFVEGSLSNMDATFSVRGNPGCRRYCSSTAKKSNIANKPTVPKIIGANSTSIVGS
jgi:hypothetical protein